jgi:hypothetical protein
LPNIGGSAEKTIVRKCSVLVATRVVAIGFVERGKWVGSELLHKGARIDVEVGSGRAQSLPSVLRLEWHGGLARGKS